MESLERSNQTSNSQPKDKGQRTKDKKGKPSVFLFLVSKKI